MANGDSTIAWDPKLDQKAREAAKGSPALKYTIAAGGTIGTGAVVYAFVSDLTSYEKLAMVREVGAPFILGLAILLAAVSIGRRVLSLGFQAMNYLGQLSAANTQAAAAMQQQAGSIQVMTEKLGKHFDAEDNHLVAVKASLGSLHEKVDRLLNGRAGA
jgi:hypothetical protein